MQKFITIFFTLVYLLFSIGIPVSKHFCGEELASIAFYVAAEKCACGTDAEENGDCCKDESKIFKTNDDLKSSFDFELSSKANSDILNDLLFIAPLNFSYQTEFLQFFTNFSSKIRLIPKIPLQKNPFWLVFRVFRI
jgi:hypothetical protein